MRRCIDCRTATYPMTKRDTAYKSLKMHFKDVQHIKMRDQFDNDPERYARFCLQHQELLLDYSKNRITPETMPLLIDLARASDVEAWRDRMFSGEKINITENRAVLHIALRNLSDGEIRVDGRDVMPDVRAVMERMFSFSDRVRIGEWTGYTGKKITDIVNIGVGGSDLGPRMVCEALTSYHKEGMKAHFLSNIDGAHIKDICGELNPETTLFIVSSKSFTTQETIINAGTARDWFLSSAKDTRHISRHFVAVSTNHEAVADFGINPENMFEVWDWVGGRYSLWSAIGLSILLMVGGKNFTALLAGAHSMDNHFRTAPLEENMPVILAMLGIWYNNFFKADTHALLPYDYYLRSLPTYLQQTDMESNGKSTDRYGQAVDHTTGPVIWGSMGINGQHAFYQLIHQGTKMVPADFIASIQTQPMLRQQHDIMMSNFFAQTEALMRGRNLEETQAEIKGTGKAGEDFRNCLPHMVCEGNHPSNSILLKKLTPYNLGSLLALYEHKIFVQGIVWGINSFDQWGVVLGKQLAANILDELDLETEAGAHDSSTESLIRHYKSHRAVEDDG